METLNRWMKEVMTEDDDQRWISVQEKNLKSHGTGMIFWSKAPHSGWSSAGGLLWTQMMEVKSEGSWT